MGQYYKPLNVENEQWLYSHDYNNGLKLMEHSYIGNNFVGAVMALMVKGGAWFKKRIVWAGDYYGDDTSEISYYGQCKDTNKVMPQETMSMGSQEKAILVNHTKKLYVRYDEIPSNEDGMFINPLPLLTALGNGRGGGDYFGDDIDKVGIWAGDVLSIEMKVPRSKIYKKFVVKFKIEF